MSLPSYRLDTNIYIDKK